MNAVEEADLIANKAHYMGEGEGTGNYYSEAWIGTEPQSFIRPGMLTNRMTPSRFRPSEVGTKLPWAEILRRG